MLFSMHADPASWLGLAPGRLPEEGALHCILKTKWAQLMDTSTERASVAFSAAHSPPLVMADWTTVTQASRECGHRLPSPMGCLGQVLGQRQPTAPWVNDSPWGSLRKECLLKKGGKADLKIGDGCKELDMSVSKSLHSF